MITRYSVFAASIGTFAGATVAHAHPGHGEPGDDYSLLHYVTEPLHLGVGFCLLIGAVALGRLILSSYVRRKRQVSAVKGGS
jgi:hypothetical protein